MSYPRKEENEQEWHLKEEKGITKSGEKGEGMNEKRRKWRVEGEKSENTNEEDGNQENYDR